MYEFMYAQETREWLTNVVLFPFMINQRLFILTKEAIDWVHIIQYTFKKSNVLKIQLFRLYSSVVYNILSLKFQFANYKI